MSNRDHAAMLLRLAHEDLSALQGMADANIFSNGVFGFHAQQAVEKSVKAWLALKGVQYPRIHDIAELVALLQDNQIVLPERFQVIVSFSDFAVQFRYESYEEYGSNLDRDQIIRVVKEFVAYVEDLK